MLDILTPRQESLLPLYRDKLLGYGLCTDPANRPLAEEGIREAYINVGLEPPKKIIWARSPLECLSICNDLKYQVSSQVRNQVCNQVSNQVSNQINNFCYGQHDSSWLSFYAFFNNECNIDLLQISGLVKIAQSAGWFLPYKETCIISERHNICKLKNQLLHCDGGPAIQYPDDFSVYALNGVKVTKEIAETPDHLLDPRLILTEKNAEVRREIVRKIGIERVCQKLETKVLDQFRDYVLLEIPISGLENSPRYLKMKNPSMENIYHLEGVPYGINTCKGALAWRNKMDEYEEPLKLT